VLVVAPILLGTIALGGKTRLCAVAGVMMLSVGLATAQTNQSEFSGKYEMKHGGGSFWGQRILVVQNAQSLDVTWLSQGHPVTYHFSLDGSQPACSPEAKGEDSNKCSGELKKNKLVLKIFSKDGLRVEDWKLSKDTKKLTIESQGPLSITLPQGKFQHDVWATAEFNRIEVP